MQKSKIEWTEYVWNPIKGICPVGCWYCYARKIYQRFKKDKYITFYPKELESPYKIKKPSKIFLCSTIEFFHPVISGKWRNMIFRVIEDLPQHTFQILTKFPQNIDRPMPDNCWIGVSVTNSGDMLRHWRLRDIKAAIKFISMEPLLEDIVSLPHLRSCDWVIIGRLTGYGKKYDPKKEWIERWVRWRRPYHIPIFLKNNLKEIWGEPLIQEFPKEGK